MEPACLLGRAELGYVGEESRPHGGKMGRAGRREAGHAVAGRGGLQRVEVKGGEEKSFSIFQTNFQTTFECKFKSI